jgi:hypothetical protein
LNAWFARVGLPLTPAERVALDAWTRGEPAEGATAWKSVGTWPEALSFARAMDFDATWWDREEAERERLWLRAADAHGEAELLHRLTVVNEGIAGDVRAHAAAAAAHARVADPAACMEAAGAALLAGHHDALRELAGADGSHGFARKYALFQAGRWPLGYHFGHFLIF